jgi:hypothetical protein
VDCLSEGFADLRVQNHNLRQMIHGLKDFAARAATSSEQSLAFATARQQSFTRHASGSNTPRNPAPPPGVTQCLEAVQRKLAPAPSVGLATVTEGDAVEAAIPVGEWKDVAVRRVFLGVLDVVLNQAAGLKPKLFGTRDPYAVLRMRSVSDMKVWKSSAKSNTRSPTWDERTSFLVQVCPISRTLSV